MTAETVLRRGIWTLTGMICLGLIADLALMGHRETLVQFLPFACAGFGMLAATVGAMRPSKNGRRFVWVVAAAIGIAALFGMWEHLEHNYGFEAEIRPNAPLSELVMQTLRGASPILAPGALWVVSAMLALANWRAPEA